MIRLKVPPSLGAGPEAEGEALGFADAAGELAAGELAAGVLAAGFDVVGALVAGGGAAEEVAGAGLAEVAGAGEEVVGELQPIKTIANTSRITREP